MTTPDLAARSRQLLRDTLAKLDTFRLPDSLDESWYEALRASLVAAGATDQEIDRVAACLIVAIVGSTAPGSEERVAHFEYITDHLACTKVRISLGQADTVLSIEFPNRPATH